MLGLTDLLAFNIEAMHEERKYQNLQMKGNQPTKLTTQETFYAEKKEGVDHPINKYGGGVETQSF